MVGPEQRFGLQLRRLREAAGISQEALGRLVGMTGASISRMEKGLQGLPAHELPRYAEALGVSPAAFYGAEISEREALVARMLAFINESGIPEAVAPAPHGSTDDGALSSRARRHHVQHESDLTVHGSRQSALREPVRALLRVVIGLCAPRGAAGLTPARA